MAYIPIRQSYHGVKGIINKYLPKLAKIIDYNVIYRIHAKIPRTSLYGLTPSELSKIVEENLYYGRKPSFGLPKPSKPSIFNE